jgi:heterotetrameric sarcosine oxidase delta subunit
MRCPLNGWRGINEFAYGGEFFEMPDPDTFDDRAWSEHVFMRKNHRGPVAEWWCHVPSANWFVALRNTATGEVIDTYTLAQWCEQNAVATATPTPVEGVVHG